VTAFYRPGEPWTDYELTGDALLTKQHYVPSPVRGVVFRYQDEENHYRFEKCAGSASGEPRDHCRLVKMVAGQETVLAATDNVPPPIVLRGHAWQEYPSHSIAGEGPYKPRTEHGEMDRFTVEVRGSSIACSLGGKLVFRVDDDGLKHGTVGVAARGGSSGVMFDNLEVKPLER
jgi:hypothetical protein